MPQDSQKPSNPELETVVANQAAVPVSSVKPVPSSKLPPTKMVKEVSKKTSNTRFLLGCAGGLLLLFVLFLVLMVFVMSRGGGNNAVIQAFGLAPGAIKGFLLTIINLGLGFLSLLFFVLLVIGIFRLTGAKKEDQDKRRRAGRMILFSVIPFFLLLFIWFFLFNFISRLQILAERVVAEVVVKNPEDTSNLQAPVEVTFSAIKVKQALVNSQLGVTSATWDLDGDGFFETPLEGTGEVTRLYENRGVYNVGLQVQVVGEAEPRVYTLPLTIQEALFSAEPSTGSAPLRVQFDARHLMPVTAKVEMLDWDFNGDGAYDLSGADQVRPFYTFEQIGTYRVHLRIVDELNTVENYYREIEITPSDVPLLLARIEASPGLSGTAPFLVRFDGGSSTSAKGRIVNYEWDFGDGSALEEGRSISHSFKQPGNYRVSLAVTDDSGNDHRASVNVEVKTSAEAPTAMIKTNPAAAQGQLEGTLPFRVSFDASLSTDPDNDIVDYEWDFNGDGTMDMTGKKVEYTFEQVGSFDAVLRVTDSQDQSGAATLKVVVAEPLITASINIDPSEGTVPLTVRFDGSGSSAYEGTIVSYEWDFGDSSPPTITGATLSHRYDRVGAFAVILKVTTTLGESATATRQIFVREIPLTACFEPSRSTGEAPLSVTFDPKCSTGAVAKYQWDFGDGVTSSSRKPAHTFEAAGTYTVKFEVFDDKNNVSSSTQIITVTGTVIQ